METVQPLERLQVLEKKITLVIDLLHDEREKSLKLAQENKTLTERIKTMESSLAQESKSIDELSQERVLTRKMVDELIQTIDQLVKGMPQPEGTS